MTTEDASLLLESPSENSYAITFDFDGGISFVWTHTALALSLITIAVVVIFWPVAIFMSALFLAARWLIQQEVTSQKCRLTDTKLIFERGFINHASKFIPLDRIQDVNVRQSILHRYFGICCIEVQTAGQGSPFPEAYLFAPNRADEVQEEILKRRDAIVLGELHERKRAIHMEREDFSKDLKELKEAVLRIEAAMAPIKAL